MSGRYHIVVCDDDERRANAWAKQIAAIKEVAERFDVQALSVVKFSDALEGLTRRAEAARNSSIYSESSYALSLIDDAQILIVDHDLTPGPGTLANLGAEAQDMVRSRLRSRSGQIAAYLARCYSRAGFIVVVNQDYHDPTFDLTMQRFLDSFADLHVTGQDLARRELWIGEANGFLPWAWPRLVESADLFIRRVEQLALDARVLDTLGFDQTDRAMLTARQLDILGDEPHQTTFADLVNKPEVGLNLKDRQPDEEIRRRIAAAGVGRWLETRILPAQNSVVDAPHILQRYPHVLGNEMGDRSAWDAAATRGAPTGALAAVLDRARRIAEGWTSRPVWSFADVRRVANEMAVPQAFELPDFVFCEDVSRFLSIDSATEVLTDVPGPYNQRFMAKLPDIDYHPRSRLLT